MHDLIGNDVARRCMERMVENDSVGNSLLFAGPEGVGKTLFALAMAKRILCRGGDAERHARKISSGNHPDIHLYKPEGKLALHSIDSMRSLSEEVMLPPYEAKNKIFIVQDADRMIPSAANALLKTFEEPTPDSIIILISDNPDALLPTILSRCKIIPFTCLKETDIAAVMEQRHGCSHDDACRLARQARGSLGRALRLKNSDDDNARKALFSLLSLGKTVRYALLVPHIEDISQALDDTQKILLAGAKKEHLFVDIKDLSAQQKHAVQKEIEGAVSVSYMREAASLLDDVLTWYRDLNLLSVGGDKNLLFHSDKRELLEAAFRSMTVPPLEKVQKAVIDAKLSLERSMRPAAVFENLFLTILSL